MNYIWLVIIAVIILGYTWTICQSILSVTKKPEVIKPSYVIPPMPTISPMPIYPIGTQGVQGQVQGQVQYPRLYLMDDDMHVSIFCANDTNEEILNKIHNNAIWCGSHNIETTITIGPRGQVQYYFPDGSHALMFKLTL